MEKLSEEKIMQIIKIFNLDERTRKAENIDQRFLFYRYLNDNGYKLVEIAQFFDRNHVNIFNGVKRNKIQEKTKCTRYIKNTEKLRAYLKEDSIIKDIINVQQKLDSMIDKINNLNTTEI